MVTASASEPDSQLRSNSSATRDTFVRKRARPQRHQHVAQVMGEQEFALTSAISAHRGGLVVNFVHPGQIPQCLTAVFDGDEHVFPAEDLVDLSLGYALTCHRAPGSEADYVIVALPPSRLLDPSWLYTAVTRARQQVIIVGLPETMQEALQRPYADERRTVGYTWRSFGSSGAPLQSRDIGAHRSGAS
jgi:hypothetical protein